MLESADKKIDLYGIPGQDVCDYIFVYGGLSKNKRASAAVGFLLHEKLQSWVEDIN